MELSSSVITGRAAFFKGTAINILVMPERTGQTPSTLSNAKSNLAKQDKAQRRKLCGT